MKYNKKTSTIGDHSFATANKTEIDKLKKRIDKLSMITEGLWLIVRDELKLSDEKLKEKIKNDLVDDSLEGSIYSKAAKACKNCGNPLQADKSVCIYCGKEAGDDVFRHF
ncbi:hypothetical protein RBH29_04160 [Herbivorax sp. ANBcel31]|uniref:hypothetical protein n=1 Tax=Herbivorax sp. ANBcel31 TaxID=3069754 RepID=UPI0027B51794|nr:hypothetical protein [Herbivorax sp. ANBcel31]MDQ2085628.1 hypothetical protein [Herbivorax sp. ANBcel31]